MAERLSTLFVRALESHLETKQPIQLPDGAAILWETFLSLSKTRTHADGFPQAITYQEIDAYAQLMRVPLEPHHIRAITALDAAWISWTLKPKKPLPNMTAAAFDAHFG